MPWLKCLTASLVFKRTASTCLNPLCSVCPRRSQAVDESCLSCVLAQFPGRTSSSRSRSYGSMCQSMFCETKSQRSRCSGRETRISEKVAVKNATKNITPQTSIAISVELSNDDVTTASLPQQHQCRFLPRCMECNAVLR